MSELKNFIKLEIDNIYFNLKGGFFLEIYDGDDEESPLVHLESNCWNGVCISNKKMYTSNRSCYIEPYDFNINRLDQIDVYQDNLIFQKIKRHDKSNLIHVVYINCDESIKICESFLKGCYEKSFEKEPEAGHWPTQVILLILKIHKNQEIYKLCEKYFLTIYKIEYDICIFKHEVLL